MAMTSSAVNSCDASVWLDDVNGLLRDISGSSNNVDISFDHNLGEFNSFQEQWPNRLECGKDATFTLSVIYSETQYEGWDVLKWWFFAASPGARTFNIFIPDKNVGSDKFAFEARIESLSWTVDRGEPSAIIVTAVIRPDGEVVLTEAAT